MMANAYRWDDVPRIAGLALGYFLLAGLTLAITSRLGVPLIFWPVTGLAAAAMLLGGIKYWPGVLAGEFAVQLVAGQPFWLSAIVATESSLALILGVWLLTRSGDFDVALGRVRDCFRLLLFVGLIGEGVHALGKSATLWLMGDLTTQALPLAILHDWLDDALGLAMVVPLILIWRHPPRGWLNRPRIFQVAAIFGLSFLVGQVVFLEWFHELFGLISFGYWLFLVVTLAAVCLGTHGVVLIFWMIFFQALFGVSGGLGIFGHDLARTQLVNFSSYMLAFFSVGVALSTLTRERHRNELTLRKKRMLLLSILDSIKDGVIVIGEDRELLALNKQFRLYWNVPEELIDSGQSGKIYEYLLTKVADPEEFISTAKALFKLDEERFDTLLLKDGRTFERFTRNILIGEKRARLWSLHDITARKKVEREVVQNEQRMELALSGADLGLWDLDIPSGKFTHNPRLVSMVGYATSEMEVNADTFRSLLHPDDAARFGSAFFLHLKGETPNFEIEYRVRHKDGHWVWILSRGKVVERDPNGRAVRMTGTNLDITERKRDESTLRMLWLAIEQSPSSVVITDLDARIEYVNEAFVQVSGYAREEIIGRNPSFLQSGETPRETYATMWAALAAGKTWKGDFYNRRKNGEAYIEFGIISPIYQADGKLTHYLGIAEDITERKRIGNELTRHRLHLQQMVDERTQELEVARDLAEAANRAKGAFLANMSHEIRTPMNAIIGLSGLALKTALDAKQRDYLEKIHGAGERLLLLINDILDHSKVAAGKMRIERIAFKVDKVVEQVNTLIEFRVAEKSLEYQWHLSADVPSVVIGDPYRLQQILINLLGNAVKFTARGKITLDITVLRTEGHRAQLSFSVSDSGVGLDDAHRENLFDAFTQADSSTTRKYGGTGLGLAICKQLATLMDGDIEVSSTPGQGSTFRLIAWFGLAGGEAGTYAQVDQAGIDDEEWHFRNVRILLAEDQPLNQQIVVELLGSVGAQVDVAANGKLAVDQLFSAGKDYYDLILMDIQMPEMDGISATLLIRKQPDFSEIPIIAMTANVMAEDIHSFLSAGMDDHVGKPFSPEHLFQVLSRHIPADKLERAAMSAGTAAAATMIPGLAGFDTAAAIQRFGGSTQRYVHWLDDFAKHQKDANAWINVALTSGEAGDALKRIHLLKSQAGMLGIADLQQACMRLEDDLRKGRPYVESCTSCMEMLSRSIRKIENFLASGQAGVNN